MTKLNEVYILNHQKNIITLRYFAWRFLQETRPGQNNERGYTKGRDDKINILIILFTPVYTSTCFFI